MVFHKFSIAIFLGFFFLNTFSFAQTGLVKPDGGGDASDRHGPEFVRPEAGAAMCFYRGYDESWLNMHMDQYVRSIAWMLERVPDTKNYIFQASVLGRFPDADGYLIDSPIEWKNHGTCSSASDYQATCQSDSGSYINLTGLKDHITFEISHGKAFAFSSPLSPNLFRIEGNNEGNRSFWLEIKKCSELKQLAPPTYPQTDSFGN